MIVASGFIEANGLNNVDRVVSELKTRGMKINEVNLSKVAFLVEIETIGALKTELDSLQKIEYIRDVYLTYYSLERSD